MVDDSAVSSLSGRGFPGAAESFFRIGLEKPPSEPAWWQVSEGVEAELCFLVIIFGIGDKKLELLGTMGPMDCPRCHNTTEWPIHKQRSFFSLFFIPVIPYSTRYLLSCPVCRETREISEQEKDRFLGRLPS